MTTKFNRRQLCLRGSEPSILLFFELIDEQLVAVGVGVASARKKSGSVLKKGRTSGGLILPKFEVLPTKGLNLSPQVINVILTIRSEHEENKTLMSELICDTRTRSQRISEDAAINYKRTN